jgi:outer membrane immunogenic protein
MKKTALIVTISSILGTLAYAGSAEVSGKEMKQVAPPPPPGCFDWSGPYVGLFGGYKFSSVDPNLALEGDWEISGLRDFRQRVQSAGSQDLDNNGGELGGLVGYNWQSGCWVFGFEAAGGYLWARDSNNSGTIFSNTEFPNAEVRTSFKTDYLFTLAPRFGYAFGKWLPYVTGGLAVGDLDFSQQVILTDLRRIAGEGGSDRTTNAGWMVGGGLQYALCGNWSIRAQYQYIDLGSEHFSSDFRDSDFRDFPSRHDVQLREHNASVAIMYKF